MWGWKLGSATRSFLVYVCRGFFPFLTHVSLVFFFFSSVSVTDHCIFRSIVRQALSTENQFLCTEFCLYFWEFFLVLSSKLHQNRTTRHSFLPQIATSWDSFYIVVECHLKVYSVTVTLGWLGVCCCYFTWSCPRALSDVKFLIHTAVFAARGGYFQFGNCVVNSIQFINMHALWKCIL